MNKKKVIEDNNIINFRDINLHWLIGFIEAEGSFELG